MSDSKKYASLLHPRQRPDNECKYESIDTYVSPDTGKASDIPPKGNLSLPEPSAPPPPPPVVSARPPLPGRNKANPVGTSAHGSTPLSAEKTPTGKPKRGKGALEQSAEYLQPISDTEESASYLVPMSQGTDEANKGKEKRNPFGGLFGKGKAKKQVEKTESGYTFMGGSGK